MRINKASKTFLSALLIIVMVISLFPGAYALNASVDNTEFSGYDPAAELPEYDGVAFAEEIPAIGGEDDDFTALTGGAATLTIESVQVLNGGAVQATYRPDKVTEAGGKYYTTQRIASMTDPRIFKVSTVFENKDGADNPLIADDQQSTYDAFLTTVRWTYGGKPFSEWRKAASSGVNGPFTGAPFITLVNSSLSKLPDGSYKIEAEIRFDTPLYSLTQSLSIPSNIPYANYPNVTQGSSNSFHPQLLDTFAGWYELAVRYDTDTTIDNGEEEIQLGARDVRLALYDSFLTWREIDQYAKDLKAEAESNEGVINDRYVGVQSLAKSLRGNDIWNVVIADSKASVDEYLNVTKPLLETNPTALAAQIPGGNQKLAIYFNVVHGDEIPGIDVNVRIIDTFIHDDVISFTSYDAVQPVTTSGNGYAREIEGSSKTTYSYTVDEALDKFIIVITITNNTDGRDLLLRGSELGFDHNRQAVAQRTIESAALTSDMRKWNPVEFNEYHGYTSSMLIMPGTGPHAPYFEHDLLYPKAVAHAHTMGRAILGSTPLRSYTVPYDYWREGWDDGGRGAGYFYSYLIGSLGRTIEIPYANEDAVDAVQAATKSLIYAALQDRDALYLNKLEYARRAVENEDLKDKVDPYIVNPYRSNEVVGRPRTTDENGNERKYFPDYYIIPVDKNNQYNVPEAYENLEQLERNGAKFKKTTAPVTVEGVTYPVGTYVIDMRQYTRAFIQAALSEGYKSSYFTDTYAEVTVNFPALRGFKVVPIWNAGLFDDTAQSVDNVVRPAIATDAAAEYVVVKSGSVDVIKLVNRLLKNDKPVRIITSYTPEGKIGDFIAKSADIASVKDGLVAITADFAAGGAGLDAVSRSLVKPKIAAVGSPLTYSYPQGSNVTPFKYLLPYLEFSEDDYSITNGINAGTIPGYNVVVNDNVSISASVLNGIIANGIPYVGIRGNGVSSAANLTNFVLGSRTSSPGSAEATFKVDISPTSAISSFFADHKSIYYVSSSFFGTVPAGTKNLITVQTGEDNFIGGWWRNASSTASGYNHTLMDGKVSAIYGLAGTGKNVPVTLFSNDTSFRVNTRAYWPLIAQAIYLGSSGIVDTPRPNVAADITTHGWATEPYEIGLTTSASDVTQSTATIAKKLFKLNTTELEPVYSAADLAWSPIDGNISISAEGENYLHWYVENSDGNTHQGTYGPYYLDLSAPVIGSAAAVDAGGRSVQLSAEAADAVSGIAGYQWQTKNAAGEWVDAAEGASATISGLKLFTQYAFRVQITDNAGNVATGDELTVSLNEPLASEVLNALSELEAEIAKGIHTAASLAAAQAVADTVGAAIADGTNEENLAELLAALVGAKDALTLKNQVSLTVAPNTILGADRAITFRVSVDFLEGASVLEGVVKIADDRFEITNIQSLYSGENFLFTKNLAYPAGEGETAAYFSLAQVGGFADAAKLGIVDITITLKEGETAASLEAVLDSIDVYIGFIDENGQHQSAQVPSVIVSGTAGTNIWIPSDVLGDFDGDGQATGADLAIAITYFGVEIEDAAWYTSGAWRADLSKDGIIDIADLTIAAYLAAKLTP